MLKWQYFGYTGWHIDPLPKVAVPYLKINSKGTQSETQNEIKRGKERGRMSLLTIFL